MASSTTASNQQQQKNAKLYDLQTAIVSNNLARLREVLESLSSNPSIDFATIRLIGRATPISFAVYRSRDDVLEILLEYPFDINRLSCDHLGRIEPPLCSAVRIGKTSIVKRLLSEVDRIQVNQTDFFNQTPLWVAVKFRRLDIVLAIISHPNFRIDHRTFSLSRSSPLYLSSKYVNRGRQEIFQVLLTAGLPYTCIDSDSPDSIEELYDGVKIHPVDPSKQGLSVFIEIALVHSDYSLLRQCLNAGMHISAFRDSFINPSLRQAITDMTPRTLFSEARLVIRKILLSRTRKPITVQLVDQYLPALPRQLKFYLTQL